MKRCPQCEFIYEDDQSLCDMDGVLLVLDSRTLPNMSALTTVTTKTAPPKRHRAVPAFATVILALVLGMVYYVSTQRKAAQSAYTPTTVESAANPAPAESPVQVAATEPQPQPAVEEPKTTVTKPVSAAAAVPAKKTAPKASISSQTKPAAAPAEKKDDSKVGSILKKTGRILKKPFKL